MAERYWFIAESGQVRTDVPELANMLEGSRAKLDDPGGTFTAEAPLDATGKPMLSTRVVSAAALSVEQKDKIHLLMTLTKIDAIRIDFAMYGIYRILGSEWDAKDDEQLKSAINWLLTSGWSQEVIDFATAAMSGGVRWGNAISAVTDDALFLGRLAGRDYHYSSEKSLVTIAPPGAGKTQCMVLPNLMTYAGSTIVLDIKGECLRETGDRRREFGKVHVFSPHDTANSAHYNPLDLLPDDDERIWEESRYLAELLVPKPASGDQVWANQGRHLLTFILAHIGLHMEHGARSMETVLDLISGIDLKETLDAARTDENTPAPLRRAAQKFHTMEARAPKQFEGVLSGASEALAVWEGVGVNRITKTSDWQPLDFRGDEPVSLFLCIPPNAIETYAPLLRVIIGQHVRELMREEPNREQIPILFMLDELPRLGQMEPIREALEVGRSYRLKLWMFLQYVGQLDKAYGREISEGMLSSCGVRTYMNCGADIAQTLSRQIGDQHGLFDGKKHPLVTAQELTGPEWENDILVLETGKRPVRLSKAFYHHQSVETPEPSQNPSKKLSEQEIAEIELAARSRL